MKYALVTLALIAALAATTERVPALEDRPGPIPRNQLPATIHAIPPAPAPCVNSWHPRRTVAEAEKPKQLKCGDECSGGGVCPDACPCTPDIRDPDQSVCKQRR
jgi:hypothetical protein